jgi:hypothetical protein
VTGIKELASALLIPVVVDEMSVTRLQYLRDLFAIALPFGGYADAEVTSKKLLLMPINTLRFLVTQLLY